MSACAACVRSESAVAPPAPAAWSGFHLPAVLEATRPAEARLGSRDMVRLLVTAGDLTSHTTFPRIGEHLRAGDLLVVNDSATIPAALTAFRDDGTELALHLSTPLPGSDNWVVEPRGAVVAGVLRLEDGGRCELLRLHGESKRLWEARLVLPTGEAAASMGRGLPVPLLQFLQRWGRPVRYPYVTEEWPMEAYQTIFARVPGSAEMPSAARPFTDRTLQSLAARGVGIASITLHTGVASLERDEAPYAEYFDVPARTLQRMEAARRHGGRVVAVGTTVVRALATAMEGATRGWTTRIVTPSDDLPWIDGLLTGLHEPRATHLAMLLALCDGGALQQAYDEALREGYLWHEFGDVHLLLRRK